MRLARLAIHAWIVVCFVVATHNGALAESTSEMASDLLHSDLPLFGDETEAKWPQAFADKESFGCSSRVAFGDWMLRAVDEEEDDADWYRVQNYGVFHCWAMVGSALRREELPGADLRPSFFVYLGVESREGLEVELWTIQMGARPGSDYLLLSRVRSQDRIEKFDVLQTDCPRANTRDAGSVDILLTRYCAIDSRDQLLSLASRMVQRPPRGTLSFVGPGADNNQ